MKLRVTRIALSDLEDLLDYIQQHSPQGARKVQTRIRSTLELIERFPQIGQRSTSTIRRMPVASTPYLVFYELTERANVVLAIRHAARDPRSMPGGTGD